MSKSQKYDKFTVKQGYINTRNLLVNKLRDEKGMICWMIDWLVFVDIQKAIKMEHVFVLLANSLPKLINLRTDLEKILNGVYNDL